MIKPVRCSGFIRGMCLRTRSQIVGGGGSGGLGRVFGAALGATAIEVRWRMPRQIDQDANKLARRGRRASFATYFEGLREVEGACDIAKGNTRQGECEAY